MPVVTGSPSHALADRIKELREAKGYSREMLAAVAEVSFSTVTRLESGQVPRVEALGQIAEALQLSPEQLGQLVILARHKD